MITNKIIDAAFDSLFRDFSKTLRIGLLPFLIAVPVFLALVWPLMNTLMSHRGGPLHVGVAQVVLSFIGALALVYAGTIVAVRWHCFSMGVPVDRQSSLVRPFPYFLKSCLIGLGALLVLLVVVVLPSSLFLGPMSIRIGDFGEAWMRGWPHVLVNAIGTFGFIFLFQRWAALSLVGTAIGNRKRDKRWTTKVVQTEIVQISLIYTLATFLWTFVGGLATVWFVALPLDLAFVWVAFMLSIAVLTEIYREVVLRMGGGLEEVSQQVPEEG